MGTFLEQQQLADDSAFRLRVRHAVCRAALDVNGEAQGVQSVALWKARSRLGPELLRAPDEWALRFAKAIVAYDLAMTAGSLDAIVQANVNAVYNDFAAALADTV